MKKVLAVSLLLAFCMLTASTSAEEAARPGNLTILSKKVGNLFMEGEPVTFMVTAENFPSDADLTIESVDFDEKVVATVSRSRYGEGRAVAETSFGVQPLGYYRIRAKVLKGGETVSEKTESYGVILSPEQRRSKGAGTDSSRFAIDVAASWFFGNKEDLRKASEVVRLAGISCVRDRFSWAGIESEKGNLRWGWYDTSASAQHDGGLTVYQIFHDCPAWASGKKDRRYPPTNPEDMGNFFGKMVEHFKDRVKYWEIWNEPDIDVFYLGKPKEYAECLKESYRQIKKADPEAKVLICSFAMAPGEFAEKIFEEGITDFFDIYNVHYYGNPRGLVYRLNSHKKLMKKYGVEKPIWVTEMGASHPKEQLDPKTLRGEAEYLVKAYVYGLSNGVERFFYFIFSDYTERDRNFGTVNRDFTPRPAYIALCNLTYLLEEGKFLRKGEVTGEGVECYVFQDGKQEVAVVWAEQRQDVRFRLNSPDARAFDVIGRNAPLKRFSDGRLEVSIGPEPVFVQGLGR